MIDSHVIYASRRPAEVTQGNGGLASRLPPLSAAQIYERRRAQAKCAAPDDAPPAGLHPARHA